jgi:hypothetical protein
MTKTTQPAALTDAALDAVQGGAANATPETFRIEHDTNAAKTRKRGNGLSTMEAGESCGI